MIKREELTNPESCMSRALPEERTFVLLARDACAPAAIRTWAEERLERGYNRENDPQIVGAYDCAALMEEERDGIKEILKATPLGVADKPDLDASRSDQSQLLAQIHQMVHAEVQRPGDNDQRFRALKRVRAFLEDRVPSLKVGRAE
jgi:hypothetical protein